MATLVFDGSEDSVANAQVLVSALTEWLKEQTPTPASGRADFRYRPDGTLDSVLILHVDEAV